MKKEKEKSPFKNIQPQEIWLAKVYFEETNQAKIRPVIVVDYLNDSMDILIISLKVTSQGARDIYGKKGENEVGLADASEVPLIEWQDENLLKPSIVRTSKVLLMPQSFFLRKLGNVSEKDWRNVLKAYRKKIKEWGKDWKQKLRLESKRHW